jgi:hypothetical protein
MQCAISPERALPTLALAIFCVRTRTWNEIFLSVKPFLLMQTQAQGTKFVKDVLSMHHSGSPAGLAHDWRMKAGRLAESTPSGQNSKQLRPKVFSLNNEKNPRLRYDQI